MEVSTSYRNIQFRFAISFSNWPIQVMCENIFRWSSASIWCGHCARFTKSPSERSNGKSVDDANEFLETLKSDKRYKRDVY